MNWYIEVLKKYAEFNGRARRKEYWMFALIHCLIYFGYCIVAVAFVALTNVHGNSPASLIVFLPLWLYAVALMVPSIAVSIRRLHDTGRSGWWFLISLVPFVGGIILLVFMCQDSQPGPNQYGPNPKGVAGYGQYYPAAPGY